MKKIALLAVTVVVLIAATFVSYQSLFMQNPSAVLAEISKKVNTVTSVDANSHMSLTANGVSLIDAVGNVKSSGKPMSVTDFLGSNPTHDATDKFSEEFSITTEGKNNKVQAILNNHVLYVKNAALTDKWISQDYLAVSKEASSTGTNLPVEAKYMNALSLAGDYIKDFQFAREVAVEKNGDKEIRQYYIPINEDEWKRIVDSKYPSLRLGASNVSVDANIWIDAETLLPTKYDIALKVDKPVPVTATCSLTYISFNQVSNIQPPASSEVISESAYKHNDELKAMYEKAAMLFNAGDVKGAQSIVSKVAVEWPTNPSVMELLAQIEFTQEHYDLANNYLDKAEVLNNKSAVVFTLRSFIAYENKRYGAAVAYGKKAIEKNPLYPDAYFALGCGYYGLKNTAEACGSFEKAMELDPEMAGPATMISICQGKHENYDTALRYYKKDLNKSLSGKPYDEDIKKLIDGIIKDFKISIANIRALPQDTLKQLTDVSKVTDLNAALDLKGKPELEKPVLIYFYEKQCPISLELADALKDLKDKHANDISFFVFDVAGGPEMLQLVNTYGVKNTPAIIIIGKDTTVAGKYEGYVDNRELEKWILDAK
jgi:tetratricopeptide (TPR) repeat protein